MDEVVSAAEATYVHDKSCRWSSATKRRRDGRGSARIIGRAEAADLRRRGPLKNAPIRFRDEATNSLDSVSSRRCRPGSSG